ncbi:hypothetical protein ACQCN2_18020 [Brevibacillus ginsengisoli]|uniref:hypothetical protein n=1 Tax=Brevibacillus ginsengisoli TaxID=363854 RepID=UPI003CF81358
MSSQDEQIIWEDLNSFPEQSLSWERTQVILENIREERKKIEKMRKRKKYVGWVANGLIACVAVLAFIWMKPFSSSVDTSGNKVVIDQKYITAAQKEIKALGINKEFHFEEMEKDTDFYIIRTKNEEAFVGFKQNTTEVRYLKATCTVNELPAIYKKYVDTAQDELKKSNQSVFQKVELYKNMEGTTLLFRVDDKQYVDVDLKTNKVSNFSIDYKPDDVDKKYVTLAQKALMQLSGTDSFSFTRAEKLLVNGEEQWILTNDQQDYVKNYSATIGAKTGRVYMVHYITDQYKIKSINEVIPVVKPLIKNIFGLDITGYKTYGDRSWGGYVLKGQGKPDISIKTQDFNIGSIYSINVEW